MNVSASLSMSMCGTPMRLRAIACMLAPLLAMAGAEGIVVTVMTPDQAGAVRSLARAAGITPTVTNVNAAHPLLSELSGPTAPKVAARPQTAEDIAGTQRQRPGQPGRRRAQSGGQRTGGPRAGGRPGAPAAHPRSGARSSNGRRSAPTGR